MVTFLGIDLRATLGRRMNLKKAIISILGRDSLKPICRDFELETDHRSLEMMAAALASRKKITAEVLLDYLSEAQVKEVCGICGIPGTGRRGHLIKVLLRKARGPNFVAIDFETADYHRDSACAVGLVRVENHRIVERTYSLIKPPRKKFVFTYLHGITWEDVANQPNFGELWPTYSLMLEGIDFLAAHNASFDRSVLQRCCAVAGLQPPRIPFRCTVQLARQTWNIYPTKLNHVCDHLGITLKHHQAASDAEACALIVMAAQQISPK